MTARAGLHHCFARDWAQIQERVMHIKSIHRKAIDAEKTRVALRRDFRALRAIFRFYAVRAPSKFKLDQRSFSQIFEDAGLLAAEGQPKDWKSGLSFTIAKCDRIFSATCSGRGGKEHDVGDESLERHEFLLATLQVAVAVFKKPGIVGTVAEAVNMLLDMHVLRLSGSAVPEPDEFRAGSLYRPETACYLGEHIPKLKKLFIDLVGSNLYMDMSTWHDVMMRAPWNADEGNAVAVSSRDYELIFVLSKLTLIEERHDARHHGMAFFDFVEALWRVSNLIDPRRPSRAFEDVLEHLEDYSALTYTNGKSKAVLGTVLEAGAVAWKLEAGEIEREPRSARAFRVSKQAARSAPTIAIEKLGFKRAVWAAAAT